MKITTQIQGGLGNQLFQYATGMALSKRLKRQLRLDIEWFKHGWEDVTPRHFLLNGLRIEAEYIEIAPPLASPKKWRQILQRFLPINPYVLKDRPYRFNRAIHQLKPYQSQDIYLMGYWQSFRYFQEIRDELIAQIVPSSGVSSHYQPYLEKIRNSPSAMVHVRRGDYVHLPAAAKVHGFLGLDYYQKGMDILLASDPSTQFFVFSDDIDWVRVNLPYQNRITFIESAGTNTDPIQELFLMTQCQKHLIANSSLSWWGAWLSSRAHSQVIAPHHWTNDRDKSWDDLLPKQWQRI